MMSHEEIVALRIAKERAESDAERARAEMSEMEEALRREMHERVEAIRAEMQQKDEINRREMAAMRAKMAAMREAMGAAPEMQPQIQNTPSPPVLTSSSPTSPTSRPLCEDPEKKTAIQQHLMLFLHAQGCLRFEANTEHWQCNLTHCRIMKGVVKHLRSCHAGRSCTVLHCNTTRQIVAHWKNCSQSDCAVCLPARQAERHGNCQMNIVCPHQAARIEARQAQAPKVSVVTAAADSQSMNDDVGDAGLVVNETSASNEAGQPGELVNADSRPASPQLSETLETNDIIPFRSRVDKDWHQWVTTDLRKRLITKLMKTITPPSELPSMAILDSRMYNIGLYVRKLEVDIYEEANCRSSYYHLLAEKTYKIQKELEENRQKRREQRQQVQLQQQPAAAEDAGPNLRVFPTQPTQMPQQQLPGCLQTDAFLNEEQRQQLQHWYMHQRLMLFQRQQQVDSVHAQPIPSTSGYQDANDLALVSS